MSHRLIVGFAVSCIALNILSAAYLLLLVHYVSAQGDNLASATQQFAHIAREFAHVATQLARLRKG